MEEPLVSIIIPLYNKEDSIKTTIKSVIEQTYTNIELIIVNDGSTDKSEERVQEIIDGRIKLISKENEGVSAARNAGILAAKGNWILFLDADDVLLPDALKLLVDNIINETTIIAANFLINSQNGLVKYLHTKHIELYNDEKSIHRAWAMKRLFLRAGSFIMPTGVAKQELFNTYYSRFEDMDFLLRCFKLVRVKLLPRPVMIYDISFAEASRVNSNKWEKDYLFYLPFQSKQFWLNCLLGELLSFAISSYPSKKKFIKTKYENYLRYITISKVFHWHLTLRYDFFKRLGKRIRNIIRKIC